MIKFIFLSVAYECLYAIYYYYYYVKVSPTFNFASEFYIVEFRLTYKFFYFLYVFLPYLG